MEVVLNIVIVMVAVGAGFSVGVYWERQYWVRELEKLAERFKPSDKD